MTPNCTKVVDELIATNETFASLTVEQLLYAAIKDTDYETVFDILQTTDWNEWFYPEGKI
jgi:hypothetical protein